MSELTETELNQLEHSARLGQSFYISDVLNVISEVRRHRAAYDASCASCCGSGVVEGYEGTEECSGKSHDYGREYWT